MLSDEGVVREVELEAPVVEVWASLTEPSRLSAWLGGTVELDVRPGGRGAVRRDDGAVRRVLVEEVEPMRRLVIRWWPFQKSAGDDVPLGRKGPPGPSTEVEFQVLPGPNGTTTLRVVERATLPFPPGHAGPVDAIGVPWQTSGPSGSDLQAVVR